MKTIFITIFEGVEVKNILRTPILENLLKEKDIRIVLFTKSEEKVDYYKKEFNDPRLIFEVVENKNLQGIDNFFAKLKFVLLKTETTDLKRKMVAEYEHTWFHYYMGRAVNHVFARPIFRKIARFLDFYLVKDSTYKIFFDKYNPNLVFMAHLFDEPEIAILREAKKRKISSIGFINSWDKVTARCILRLLPDKAIVFNQTVKQELINYNEMKEENIFISGLPQYDFFFDKPTLTRDEFFKKKELDPNKKLIVYATMGRTFSTTDWDIIDLLSKIVNSNSLIKQCELLVRFQPNDFFDREEIEKRPHLKYDQPGIRFGTKRGVDWDMNFTDLDHLKNTLTYMDILISYASSIGIDAALFNKPIINIDFEIKKKDFILKSPTQYYATSHYKNALKTNAIDLVKSKEEMIDIINKYLNNPEIKSEERKKLVFEQCNYTDGKSGERITKYILEQIK
jgi:CDP-glycerol glycerophosphotransferase (TagB/SpsB family)